MTVAVQQPNTSAKKDPLDQIQQALNIATSIYGVALERDKAQAMIDQNKAKNDANALEKERQNRLDTKNEQDRQINHIKDWVPAKEGTPNALPLPGYQGLWLPRASVEKAAKSAETSQSERKQEGLFEMGSLAEKQYQTALRDGYDPTKVSNPIDNSRFDIPIIDVIKDPKAVQAANAEDSWTESFLRDASGASIALEERRKYNKLYFPRMGDSPQVVEDKRNLRKQKMATSLIGAGKSEKEIQMRMKSLEYPKMVFNPQLGKRAFVNNDQELADANSKGFK